MTRWGVWGIGELVEIGDLATRISEKTAHLVISASAFVGKNGMSPPCLRNVMIETDFDPNRAIVDRDLMVLAKTDCLDFADAVRNMNSPYYYATYSKQCVWNYRNRVFVPPRPGDWVF